MYQVSVAVGALIVIAIVVAISNLNAWHVGAIALVLSAIAVLAVIVVG